MSRAELQTHKDQKLPPPRSRWRRNLLETVGGSTSTWTYFYQNLVGVDTRRARYTSSVTEHYVYGHVESPFQYGLGSVAPNPGYLDITKVPLSDFTRRLCMVLNTYYIASLAPQASTGTMSSANATRLFAGEDPIQGGFYDFNLLTVNAIVSSSTDVYRCDKTFFALAIISSAILFLTGVAGVVTQYCCKGPDMLSYVTSIVQHNPHTSFHTHNETLNTSELARQSKKMFLRLEDVNEGTDDVGHIAISMLRKTSIRQARIQDPYRKYQ